jgi:uncharacterized protein YndB with AHSA1/START domain
VGLSRPAPGSDNPTSYSRAPDSGGLWRTGRDVAACSPRVNDDWEVLVAVQGSESIVIAAPAKTIWPWLVDVDRHGEWSPKPFRAELVSGEAGALGARYRSVGEIPGDKSHANDVEITEAVEPSLLVIVARDSNGEYVNTYTLVPSGDGTEVTFHLQFPEMSGVAKFLLPVLFPLVAKRDFRQRLALLKAKIESAAR